MFTTEQIYLQYHDKVRAYVRGKIQDPHDVEDLVSAVFMKIVQKLDSYDPAKASVSTWVYTITRNTVTDHFRTQRTLVTLEDYMVDEQPTELSDDALDSLADALLALKEKARDLIVLHYYTGHTLKETAEMMGMDKQELADDLLDQVAGGAEEGEIQVFYCARDCKCSREFKCDANGKWVCMTCGKYRGSINVFA